MSRLGTSLALAALIGSGCATPRKQEPVEEGPAGADVALKFTWPDGVTAKVRSEQRKTRQGQEYERSVLSETRTWERSGTELLIRSSEVQVEGDEQRARIIEQVPPPTEVIDATTGKFVRLDNVDAAVAALQGAIGDSSVQREGMDALLKTTLVAASESDWDNLVGFWNGRTVTLNRGGREERMGPGLPGTDRMNLTYEFRAVRAIPCHARTVEQKCILLTAKISPEAEQLPEIGNRFMRAMEAAAGREGDGVPPITDFQLVTTVELITEPDTLIPHRFTKNVAMTVEFDIPIRGKVKMEQTEHEDSVFSYQPAR